VSVSIDAFPDTTFSGRVTQISNSSVAGASAQSGTDQAVDFEVEITLDNPPPGVRPDLSATARIVTDRRRQALSVPIIALTVRPASDTLAPDTTAREGSKKEEAKGEAKGESEGPAADSARMARSREIEGVFVVDTTTQEVRFRAVRTGIAGDEFFEILSGVAEGETIVAGPYQAIRDLRNQTRVRNSGGGPGNQGQAKRQ
jgi:HlyD family secretion protein